MIKNLKNITAATMATVAILNTGVVFADSNKDIALENQVALVNVDKLNIRSGPSTSYDIIGAFKKEDNVDLISIKDGWYKIKLEDGKKAWTNGQYITLDGEITVNKLNVRKGPDIKYDIVDVKEKSDNIKIISAEKNGWYEIELSDNKTGFVCGNYVETDAKNNHDYSDLYNKKASKSSIKAKTTNSSNIVSTMTVSATAYAGDSITSTGTTPKAGRTIAVDPSVIPYGTKVYIPLLGKTYIAEDCGGAIKGNKIDIFMASESQCNSWGVRNIEIQILK